MPGHPSPLQKSLPEPKLSNHDSPKPEGPILQRVGLEPGGQEKPGSSSSQGWTPCTPAPSTLHSCTLHLPQLFPIRRLVIQAALGASPGTRVLNSPTSFFFFAEDVKPHLREQQSLPQGQTGDNLNAPVNHNDFLCLTFRHVS